MRTLGESECSRACDGSRIVNIWNSCQLLCSLLPMPSKQYIRKQVEVNSRLRIEHRVAMNA